MSNIRFCVPPADAGGAGGTRMNAFTIEEDFKYLADRYNPDGEFDSRLYVQCNAKRGLRNADGTGIVAGLTRISNVHGYLVNEYERVPVDGELYYRGINVADLIAACGREDRFGYEEASWLLLFGELPTMSDLKLYSKLIEQCRKIPNDFIDDIIMRTPSRDIMNMLARAVLALYNYDEAPDDTSEVNSLRQSMELIGRLPVIMVAAYQAKRRAYDYASMFLHMPVDGLSTSENILSTLRADRKFTHEEALLLDRCMILHAEHGGGNNSAFVCRAVTSSATDAYSAVSAAIGALKGPRHGGANLKVCDMLDELKANIRDVHDDDEILAYLKKILAKEAGDGSGLIYGMGHAVYTKSDPRAVILKREAEKMVDEKGFRDDFTLLDAVERLSPSLLNQKMVDDTGICANVDMYSGLVYRMLGIPRELFTPLFAVARMSGWCAHRLEEIQTSRRIMRPAYRPLTKKTEYVDIANRG